MTLKQSHKQALETVGAVAGGVVIGNKFLKGKQTYMIPAVAGVAGAAVYATQTGIAKTVGLALMVAGATGAIEHVAKKVPALNGVGEVYVDDDGNLIELAGGDLGTDIVQDQNGNTYFVNGIYGDEDAELMGYDDEDAELMGYDDDYEIVEDLEGIGEAEDAADIM